MGESKATLSGSGVASTGDITADITSSLAKFPPHFTYGIEDPPITRQIVLKSERLWDELAAKKVSVGSNVQGVVEKGPKVNKEKKSNIDTTIQKIAELSVNTETNKENKKWEHN